jgi:ParB family chromosome partitioning protein
MDQIIIKDRVREEIGDLTSLMESMTKFGLLNPITISDEFELLAGFRRYTAAKELGWSEIDAHVVDARTKLEKFEVEMEENLTRKDFTPKELEKSLKIREKLSSRGLKKLLFWLKKFWEWIKSLFKKDEENE